MRVGKEICLNSHALLRTRLCVVVAALWLATGGTLTWLQAADDARPANEASATYLLPIVLTPDGFEPLQMNLRPARVVLAVYNRTGLKELSLALDRQEPGELNKNRIKQERVPRTQSKWRNQLDLAPGRYILTEENHPEWMCQIIVAEN